MPKYSVKKPFTVLVAVILVVVLGFVSLTGMQTDLLPNMNLPYLLVITTYPGASPEQVESDVTQPLENSLSTLNGVKNVTSQSNENYSLVILEYQDDTDMDSAMVKASTAVNQLSGSLPDMASTPTLMEMSPDMMATQYVAVDYEGMDIYELSDYVEDTIVPQLERVDGVASVSTTGLVKKSVQITLDQDKIDEVNDKLLVKVSDRLAEAKKQLDENEAKIKDGLAELDSAQSQLDSGKAQLNTQKQSLTQQLRDAIDQLNEEIPKLEEQIAGLKTQLDTAQRKLNQLKVDPSSLPEVTLPIDDALFASCKEILAKYDPQYDANAMPANLEEAKSDLTKMAAMLASIERAQQAIETEAAALTGGQSVSDACAALDAQILTLTVQVQQKDNEIVQLEQQLDTAAPEEQDAIRAEIESKKAEQAALQTQLDTATSQRAALDGYKSDESTLSTTQTALRNATVLLKARQEAETSLNESTEELRQTLQQTITTLNTQIDKAEAMLANLNDQRGKLQSMLESLSANPTDPQLADMAVQLLLSGTEAQLSLGEFQISSGRTQLEAGQTQLDSAREEYESAREEALKSANLDQLLNMNTLKQLIAAQNFSMPAGYIDGGEGDDNQYILKIGDAFDNVDELKSMVLCSIDGIGDVGGEVFINLPGVFRQSECLGDEAHSDVGDVGDQPGEAGIALERIHDILDGGPVAELVNQRIGGAFLHGAENAVLGKDFNQVCDGGEVLAQVFRVARIGLEGADNAVEGVGKHLRCLPALQIGLCHTHEGLASLPGIGGIPDDLAAQGRKQERLAEALADVVNQPCLVRAVVFHFLFRQRNQVAAEFRQRRDLLADGGLFPLHLEGRQLFGGSLAAQRVIDLQQRVGFQVLRRLAGFPASVRFIASSAPVSAASSTMSGRQER